MAQRRSPIRDADQILVLERGQVVQRGGHERLLSEPQGAYAQLVAGQAAFKSTIPEHTNLRLSPTMELLPI